MNKEIIFTVLGVFGVILMVALIDSTPRSMADTESAARSQFRRICEQRLMHYWGASVSDAIRECRLLANREGLT